MNFSKFFGEIGKNFYWTIRSVLQAPIMNGRQMLVEKKGNQLDVPKLGIKQDFPITEHQCLQTSVFTNCPI